ncbi:nicotinate-nucleotide adenylyltransferase [Mechercharimyces sp. CAU 1602]|uniref:nicotinate-nucleotide adenylyltransferase n=1 Tax=Mechercharimyces sp. CAU 1602 TaxID=2973933 RepID=UPI00216242F8|nr:nicotinate-nucleotide adenylyltransferase [Mechercharimyces sp. CAU 1602]MCS1350404.1 nicotinate-nucleotide adenylyltransferase [Mechercharimyces sp. CAU 1602]
MKIGLFGGTFDPIHIGHLIIADQTRQQMGLDEIWLIPAGDPPHKKEQEVTPAWHRLRMVELATQDHPSLYVKAIEVEQAGRSYTVRTVEALTKLYPHHEFFLMVGADMVNDLSSWYKIKDIIQVVHILGIDRAGVTMDEENMPSWIREKFTRVPLDVSVHLSSTYLRNQIKRGRSLQYLTPVGVRLYVEEHKLYET